MALIIFSKHLLFICKYSEKDKRRIFLSLIQSPNACDTTTAEAGRSQKAKDLRGVFPGGSRQLRT